jgi:apolipoprotein N-acyltransferase
VLVAATSGVSAVITPDGHIPARSDVFTADVLVRAVDVRVGSTLATRFGAGPEWVVVAAALAGLVATVGRKPAGRTRRRRGPRGASGPSPPAWDEPQQEKESA